ncbi:MAG: alcohol dehydrogenase [bacterium]|jgi:alcohol dehydrogenase
MLPEYFEFSLPTKVVYGIGILGNIAEIVKSFGKKRAILVTDEILAKVGPVDKVKDGFNGTNIEIVCTYDKVPPNSTITTVEECAALGKEHNCDLIIAIGGGSVMDTAKVANLLMIKGGELPDHMGAYLLESDEKLHPSILIPTTAGTGSEVTKVAVIADPHHDVKLPFAETQFLPELAILDPEVTSSMPPKLTAATGMDALTHAIEAYVDKEWSPASDALAIHVIKMISENILVACKHPNDLQARGSMLVASCLAGIAFSHSMVGMVHGISHALGGVYHIPHGLANALTLPEVMEYNLDSNLNRFSDVAEALGIIFPKPIVGTQSILQQSNISKISIAVKALNNLGAVDRWFQKKGAQAGIEKVRRLNRQLSYLTGMPLNLKEAGITDHLDKLEQVVTTAMEDGSMLYNPREPEASAVREIISKLFHQKVKALPISEDELIASQGIVVEKKKIKDVYTDTDMLYSVLGDFFEELKTSEIGGALLKSNLCAQFEYSNPSGLITIDTTGDDVRIYLGDAFKGKAEVVMSMNADFAHYFWHGKVNIVSALTRRQVKAKGNVPKTLKLLPILKPAFEMYPQFLKERGLAELVVS